MPPAIGDAYTFRKHDASQDGYSIEARAWVDEGKTRGRSLGQKEYQLIIGVGERFMTKYERGEDLKECLPSTETDEWIEIDFGQKIMGLRIN